jgi:hypothetical protein
MSESRWLVGIVVLHLSLGAGCGEDPPRGKPSAAAAVAPATPAFATGAAEATGAGSSCGSLPPAPEVTVAPPFAGAYQVFRLPPIAGIPRQKTTGMAFVFSTWDETDAADQLYEVQGFAPPLK